MYSEKDFIERAKRLISVGRFGTLSGCVYSHFPENLRVFIDSVFL